MPRPQWRRLPGTVVVAWLFASAGPVPGADDHQKRVLVLYSMRQEAPAYRIQERIYRERLDEGLPAGVDYYSELVDVERFEDRDYEGAFADFVVRKYRGRRFDLIIANGPTQLAFAASLRPRLFPDTPIVFTGVGARTVPNSAGLHYPFQMRASVELALQVQPQTKRIFVVCGSSMADRYCTAESSCRSPTTDTASTRQPFGGLAASLACAVSRNGSGWRGDASRSRRLPGGVRR